MFGWSVHNISQPFCGSAVSAIYPKGHPSHERFCPQPVEPLELMNPLIVWGSVGIIWDTGAYFWRGLWGLCTFHSLAFSRFWIIPATHFSHDVLLCLNSSKSNRLCGVDLHTGSRERFPFMNLLTGSMEWTLQTWEPKGQFPFVNLLTGSMDHGVDPPNLWAQRTFSFYEFIYFRYLFHWKYAIWYSIILYKVLTPPLYPPLCSSLLHRSYSH